MSASDEGKAAGSVRGALALIPAGRMLGALFGVILVGTSSGAAQAQSRTISMYHVHTKERITITYWKDGRFIPSALRKLNWFLRDWRKNKAVRIDPRTIDLIWKLHKDLGSRKPVHIICGHRSAATNAMLRRIGRRVARRSRHITGQAIDFRFPDVPQWKVRNLALAYGIGGVGYYGEGRNGFIHVDTGRVRHWPRIPQYRLARIVRKYRKLIGRGWKGGLGGGTIMVASRSASFRRGNFNRRTHPRLDGLDKKALQRQIAALKDRIRAKEAGRGNERGAPVPLPTIRPVVLASAISSSRAAPGRERIGMMPVPRPRPYEVLVLAASRMEIMPASAPATITNFASRNQAEDPIGVVIANMPEEGSFALPLIREPARADAQHLQAYPRVVRSGKGDLAVALINGDAPDVPVVDDLARHRLAAVHKDSPQLSLGMTADELGRRDGAPLLPVQMASAFWPGVNEEAAAAGSERPARQRVNRAEKGDLLTSRATPEKVRKAALMFGAREAATFSPVAFR